MTGKVLDEQVLLIQNSRQKCERTTPKVYGIVEVFIVRLTMDSEAVVDSHLCLSPAGMPIQGLMSNRSLDP
jgi:hypothetical protein